MRKTLTLTIAHEGRDKGKQYFLTEMSAMRAEKWAARVLIGLVNSGLELSDDEAASGMAGLASVMDRGSFKFAGRGISFFEFEPLLDEMLGCVQIAEPKVTRALTEDDVEEVATLLHLRSEVLKLHTGFSLAERLSAFVGRRRSREQSNTETSQEPSAQS